MKSPAAIACVLLVALTGCKVGPDFTAPNAPLADRWLQSGDPAVHTDQQNYEQWWTVFHDPTLDRLIDIAYHQNLTLLAAGTRVLEARAVLGVSIGEFYPQPDAPAGKLLALLAGIAGRMGTGSLG
jgi:outer membrane protein TolC